VVKRKYGHIRDRFDGRDFKFSVPRGVLIPDKIDLTPGFGGLVFDQGELGSCTANGSGLAFYFELLKQKIAKPITPARLFAYYNGRAAEGSADQDSGCEIRDIIKGLAAYGVPDEGLYPYDVTKFTDKPSDDIYKQAKPHRLTSYHSLDQSLDLLLGCLAAGYPFVFGIQVYESFESDAVAKSGVVPMPDVNKENCQGGHCITACGYDKSQNVAICQNSWGKDWGKSGQFTLPFDYLVNPNLASDFWTLRIVSG
jgi:C1A family cysteine protease